MKLKLYVDHSPRGQGRWTLVAMRGSAVRHVQFKEFRHDEVRAVKKRVAALLNVRPRWRELDPTHYQAEVNEQKGRR